jgi:hypothetical protein
LAAIFPDRNVALVGLLVAIELSTQRMKASDVELRLFDSQRQFVLDTGDEMTAVFGLITANPLHFSFSDLALGAGLRDVNSERESQGF